MTKQITFAEIKERAPDGPPDVRVCDFPMGGGKSQSMIRELNMRKAEDDEFRVVVLLSLKSEDERVRRDCPALNFAIPQRNKHDWRSVTEQTVELMKQGRNVATTHAAFKYYKDDIRSIIREYGYSLYVDESIAAIDTDRHNVGDIQFLIDKGCIGQDEDGRFFVLDDAAVDSYKGNCLRQIFRTLKSRSIAMMDTCLNASGDHSTVLWKISPEILLEFNDVTIITFNFYGQQLYCYLRSEAIPFRYIGVGKDGDSNEDFYFTDNPDEYYYPPGIERIGDLLHIYDTDKLNRLNYFGRDRNALSMNWFKNEENVKLVSNQADSFFKNIAPRLTPDAGAKRRMWSTFKEDVKKLTRGKSYLTEKGFLSYSTRATNNYADRTILVYAVNLFPNVTEKRYWEQKGFSLDDDTFALNHMIQWIWRSAIRNGEEVWILVPSNRMRDLLKNWVADPLMYCQIY